MSEQRRRAARDVLRGIRTVEEVTDMLRNDPTVVKAFPRKEVCFYVMNRAKTDGRRDEASLPATPNDTQGGG